MIHGLGWPKLAFTAYCQFPAQVLFIMQLVPTPVLILAAVLPFVLFRRLSPLCTCWSNSLTRLAILVAVAYNFLCTPFRQTGVLASLCDRSATDRKQEP